MTACGTANSAGRAESPGRQSDAGSPADAAAGQAGGAQRVTLGVGNSMQYTPATLVAPAGQPLELVLQNSGVIPHDFTLAEGVVQPVKIEAPAGRTGRGSFTIEQPGTYTFLCSVPGHATTGMRGRITVT